MLQDVRIDTALSWNILTCEGIYAYDDAHPIGGPGFKEEDQANFGGSFYSFTKSRVEEVRKSILQFQTAY